MVKVGWSRNRNSTTKVGELRNGAAVSVLETSDHISCVAYRIRFDPADNVDPWREGEGGPDVGWVKKYNVRRGPHGVDPPPAPLPAPAPPPAPLLKEKNKDCGILGKRPAAGDFGPASKKIKAAEGSSDRTSRVRMMKPSDYGP